MRTKPIVITVLLALALIVAPPAAASSHANTALNYDADAAHNPEVTVDVTKAVHRMDWGTGTDAILTYEDDQGETAMWPGVVNTSQDNPYSFEATELNVSGFGEFPHDQDDVSYQNASRWTTTTGASTSASVSAVETAPNVNAIEVATGGSMGSSNTTWFNFTAPSITSDVSKRQLQLAVDVVTLDAATNVSVQLWDADGDYVAAYIDSDLNASNGSAIANQTGDGFLFQRQVGKFAVQGAGDGTMSEIQAVKIKVLKGDFTGQFPLINADRFGQYTFGERTTDSGTETIYEVTSPGAISVNSLDSLGATFDSAVIRDLTFPARHTAEYVPAADVSFNGSAADQYPSYDKRVEVYYRLELPAAYDLSYSNAELLDEVELPGGRYLTVEYAEGTGTTDFGNISSWTDLTSSYDSLGNNVTVDTSVTAGTAMVLHYEYVVVSDEFEALQNVNAGAPGQQGGSGGGGIGALLMNPISWLVGASAIVVQWIRSGWPFGG